MFDGAWRVVVVRSSRVVQMVRIHRRMEIGWRIPLPLDHFFFCFLPPVAAGAMIADLSGSTDWIQSACVSDEVEGLSTAICAGLARGRKMRVTCAELNVTSRPNVFYTDTVLVPLRDHVCTKILGHALILEYWHIGYSRSCQDVLCAVEVITTPPHCKLNSDCC